MIKLIKLLNIKNKIDLNKLHISVDYKNPIIIVNIIIIAITTDNALTIGL